MGRRNSCSREACEAREARAPPRASRLRARGTTRCTPSSTTTEMSNTPCCESTYIWTARRRRRLAAGGRTRQSPATLHTAPPIQTDRKTDRQPCYSNLLVYFTYTSTVLNQLQGGRTVQAEHIQRICAVFLGVLYDSLKRKQQQLVNPVRKIFFLEFF